MTKRWFLQMKFEATRRVAVDTRVCLTETEVELKGAGCGRTCVLNMSRRLFVDILYKIY